MLLEYKNKHPIYTCHSRFSTFCRVDCYGIQYFIIRLQYPPGLELIGRCFDLKTGQIKGGDRIYKGYNDPNAKTRRFGQYIIPTESINIVNHGESTFCESFTKKNAQKKRLAATSLSIDAGQAPMCFTTSCGIDLSSNENSGEKIYTVCIILLL